MALDYSPIVLDSINPATFPEVALYVRSDNKCTLYKPPEIPLTVHNIERLRENGTEFIYINSADSEEVQAHIEKCFDAVHENKAISQFSKNLICSQIIINCINDVFKNSHMAVAFHKCRIILKQFSLKFESRDELFRLFDKLEQNFEKYLVTHSAQVTILSMYLYEKLFSADRSRLIKIGVGSMLHDIGMLYIASDIIEKTDVLSEAEYHRVKAHPKHGSDLLVSMGITEQIALDVALCHHERHDGSGYPRGLSGQRIPAHAMLVSICDIYCALTMNRPYRSASTREDALAILKSERYLFDPQIFDGFLGGMAGTAVPEAAPEEADVPKALSKAVDGSLIDELRRKMRSYSGDRNRLLQMHALLTDNIKNTYGEEKAVFTAFRAELKDFMNSLFSEDRQG